VWCDFVFVWLVVIFGGGEVSSVCAERMRYPYIFLFFSFFL